MPKDDSYLKRNFLSQYPLRPTIQLRLHEERDGQRLVGCLLRADAVARRRSGLRAAG